MALTEVAPDTRAPSVVARSPVGIVSLAGMELRAGIRGPSFRLLAVVSAILGWSAGGAPGRGVALSAWLAGETAWRFFGFVIIGWMSFLAVQDIAARTDVLVYSKPQPTERIVLSRFAAAFGQVLLALAAVYVFAVAGRLYSGGGLTGISAYMLRYLVSVGVVFFVGAASYTMALMLRTPLAGAAVGLYWVLALAGKQYLPKALYPSYSQNVLSYVFLGMCLLGVTCWFHRLRRRGRQPLAAWVRPLTLGSLVLCGVFVWHSLVTEFDPPMHTDPALEMMAMQTAPVGELAPGFRLPNTTGGLSSLADYPGRILVIGLWSPEDSESTIILDRLEDVWRKYGSRGVQPIAICISQDRSAAAVFARGSGVDFPVVLDWGTHNADKPSNASPMASAYDADTLPHVVVTDRRRLTRRILKGVDAYEGVGLERAIQERLAAQPD